MRRKIDAMKKMREFIHKIHPGAEIKIQDRQPKEGEIQNNVGWERLPFRWNDKDIYIKRAPVSDRRKFYEISRTAE